MVPSKSSDSKWRTQLRRGCQRVWFHHLLGNERFRRGGSRHESGQSGLDSGERQHPDQRHELFQRSAVDELSRSFLPPAFALKPDVFPTHTMKMKFNWNNNIMN